MSLMLVARSDRTGLLFSRKSRPQSKYELRLTSCDAPGTSEECSQVGTLLFPSPVSLVVWVSSLFLHILCLFAKVKLNDTGPWRCNQPLLGLERHSPEPHKWQWPGQGRSFRICKRGVLISSQIYDKSCQWRASSPGDTESDPMSNSVQLSGVP